MSFRDLRNFTEMMRTLGYTRLISMENFRRPNFDLIAEILIWLVKRFDQEFEVPADLSIEEGRVALIRSVAQFMVTKVNIKLNTKRLYQADGYAVIELLKITSLLYEALRSQHSVEDNDSSLEIEQLVEKMSNVKFSRELASEITTKGAKLYEFLGQEVTLREERQTCMNSTLELSEIEASVDQAINESKEKVANMKSMIENLASSETSLEKKIEKRTIEQERNTKRLQALKKVKPAFQAEYETLEVELKRLHQEYVLRHRCLQYKQHKIEELERLEQQRIEEAQAKTRRLAESIKSDQDSLKLFEEEGEGGESTSIHPSEEVKPSAPTIQSIQETANRLRTATGSAAKVIDGRRRVYGSMNPSDSSSESDDDEEFVLDDDDDDDSKLEDSRVSKPNETNENSDDDF